MDFRAHIARLAMAVRLDEFRVKRVFAGLLEPPADLEPCSASADVETTELEVVLGTVDDGRDMQRDHLNSFARNIDGRISGYARTSSCESSNGSRIRGTGNRNQFGTSFACRR
jgi:hypothetical protein